MNLVEARREAATEFGRKAKNCFDPSPEGKTPTLDEALPKLVNLFEEALILAEKRGINIAKTQLQTHIQELRTKLSTGPANHVEQFLKKFHTWTNNSADFLTLEEFTELRNAGAILESKTPEETPSNGHEKKVFAKD